MEIEEFAALAVFTVLKALGWMYSCEYRSAVFWFKLARTI